jgi:hypothetical protein
MRIGIQTIENEYYKLNPTGHWFSPNTMRFFKSKLADYGYLKGDSAFFISSEKGPFSTDKRRYSVREFNRVTGDIKTVGEFNEMTSYQAKSLLAKTLGYKIKDL